MIRAVAPADLSAVGALEAGELGGDAWSPAMLAAEAAGPGRHLVVAERAGVVVGYAATRLAGDVVDLTRIVVAPAWRRSGVGSALLAEVRAHAARGPAERMLLEVAAGNHAALAFYRRAGFVPLARRPGYYADGADALVLQCRVDRDAPTGPVPVPRGETQEDAR